MSAYSAAVLADSPLHYWRCADPGGALLHDVGSQKVALMVNNIDPVGLPYSGPVSDGGSFLDQGTAYGWFNQDSDALAAPLSLEFWLWQHSDIATQQIAFIVRSGASSFFVQTSSTTKLGGVGTGGTIADAANLTRQAWHHVVFTISGTGAGILYKDAVSVATGAVGIPPTGNYRFALGGNVGSAANQFQGALSEAAIYGSVLSAARVTAHFAAADNVSSKPVYAVNGVFNPGPGTTSLDSANIASILASVRKTF